MKEINIRLSKRTITILLGVFFIGILASIIWSFMEMSDIRRDLYAVRDDYYGYMEGDEFSEQGSSDVSYTLLSQEVKNLRVADYSKTGYEDGPEYETQPVRILEIRVKNNQDYVFNFYTYALALVGESGVLKSAVDVHPDDNQNQWGNQGTLDLIPGGEGTVYVYLPDNGQEVTSLYNTEWGEEIKLITAE